MSHQKHAFRLSLVALIALLALGFGSFAPAVQAAPPQQDDQPLRTVTVTGYGTAYGAPDIARIGLGVEAVNEDVSAAMDETNSRMDAVINTLVEAGVAREDIRTEYFSIYQDYGYGPEGPAETPRYRVSTTVTVTVRDIEVVGELLASAVEAGANIVNYLQFDIADRASLEAEARSQAVADARDRAEQLAETQGLSVGEVVEIVEGNTANVPMFDGRGGGGGGAASEATISGGQLSVNLTVQMTFTLVA